MTSADLVRTMADRLRDTKLVVVANRQPYVHEKQVTDPQRVQTLGAAAGRQGADQLEAAGERAGDGARSGDAGVRRHMGRARQRERRSRVSDPSGRLAVPPDKPKYSLRRVWLKQQEENGYYYGVSNNALWPLCHIAYARPVFNQSDWRHYVAVNRRFADVVLEEIAGTRAIVFVQDYHYALLPRMVKAARPDAVVCQFWHIPWPNPEAFRILPWQSEVLDGLLGNDLLGFHLQYHCNNFLETVDRSMEARIDQETFSVLLPRASHGDPAVSDQHRSLDVERHRSRIGVDEGSGGHAAASRRRRSAHRHGRRSARLHEGHSRSSAGVRSLPGAIPGVAQPRRARAGRSPTRDRIDRYRDLSREVGELWRRSTPDTASWLAPIVYRRKYHTPKDVAALYRATDVCVVSSLHDGMNLVAKEFVAARTDDAASSCCPSSPARPGSCPTRCRSTRLRRTNSPRRCARRSRWGRPRRSAGCGRCASRSAGTPYSTGRPACFATPARSRTDGRTTHASRCSQIIIPD